MRKVLLSVLAILVLALVVPFTPAMPPTEYVTIPAEVPEELWGHTWGLLIGGGVNVGGQVESGEMAWLPGWSRDEYLDVNEPSITWKWVKDEKVVFEYKLLPNKCVKIGKMSVKFTIEPKEPYWKYDVSKCSWW